MHIRPANESDDLLLIQALYEDLLPDPPPQDFASQVVKNHHVRVVETEAGNVIGFRVLTQNGFVWVAVVPDFRQQGIGTELMDNALEQARALGLSELTSQFDDADLGSKAFSKHYQFEPYLHWVSYSLNLNAWDESNLISSLEQARNNQIQYRTFEELGDTETNRLRLYELNKTLSATILREHPQEFMDFETYQRQRLNGSFFPHSGVFVAIDDHEWIGMTQVSLRTDYAFLEMTGVLPEYRGKGIASALKLLSIRYVKQREIEAIRTYHDVINTPIIAVNEKAGFIRGQSFYRVKRNLLLVAE